MKGYKTPLAQPQAPDSSPTLAAGGLALPRCVPGWVAAVPDRVQLVLLCIGWWDWWDALASARRSGKKGRQQALLAGELPARARC